MLRFLFRCVWFLVAVVAVWDSCGFLGFEGFAVGAVLVYLGRSTVDCVTVGSVVFCLGLVLSCEVFGSCWGGWVYGLGLCIVSVLMAGWLRSLLIVLMRV